jgi:hypothetical protein
LAFTEIGFVLHNWSEFPGAQGFVAGFFIGGPGRIQLSHDQESLNLEYRFIQAVF